MATDGMNVRLQLRRMRVVGVVEDECDKWFSRWPTPQCRALPGVRVQDDQGARVSPGGDPGSAAGSADDAGVVGAPLRVHQLRSTPHGGPP